MDLTRELILGFGRTLKAIRERRNLSQKDLAEGIGIGIAQVKRYEQENLELIGPNGFTLLIFSKLANFLDVHPILLLQEMVSYTDLPPVTDSQAKINDLAANISSETLDKLLSAERSSEAPFKNDLRWSLEMAARLSELPGEAKAEIGQKILQEQLKAGLVSKADVTKHLQDLFKYTIS